MPLEQAQDLAADVLVRVAVVAHVEVRELRLVEALLGCLVVLEPVQEGSRGLILAQAQEGGDDLDRLAGAVLPHEGLCEPQGAGRVVRPERKQRPARLLGGQPVAGAEPNVEQRPARVRALRGHINRALDERGGRVEAARLRLRGSGCEQHGLQQVPRGHRVAGEQALGRGPRPRVG